MAKKHRKPAQAAETPTVEVVTETTTAEVVITPTEAPAAEVVTATEAPAAPVVTSGRLRLPLPEAKAHNSGFAPVAPEAPVEAAGIAFTKKGTNPKRVRVYGYDNTANGGGVPKGAKVAVVPGIANTPSGVRAEQWQALTEAVAANPAHTVETLYGAGIQSRTIRRAYRAGAIRFVA